MTVDSLAAQLLPPVDTRYLATVTVVVGFLLTAVAIWATRSRLDRVLDPEAAEAVQSIAITVVGAVAAAWLVSIWQLVDEVRAALAVVTIDGASAVKLLVTLLVLAGGYTVTRVTKRFFKHGGRREPLTEHQREVIHHVFQLLVFVPVVLFTLALWGFKPGDLLLGAGAAGLIIGLAARQVLGAALSGFVLLFSRPFEVGDWVVIDDQEGVITNISMVNTQLRTYDDEHVIIPNDTITGTDVVNRSRSRRLRVQVPVGIDYDTDIERAASVAAATMADLDEVMDSPAPDVVFDAFGDSAVILTLRFWIYEPTISKKWNAQTAVIEAVKDAFEDEGIKIPFPQRELGTRPDAAGEQLLTARSEDTDENPDDDGPADDSDEGERPPPASEGGA